MPLYTHKISFLTDIVYVTLERRSVDERNVSGPSGSFDPVGLRGKRLALEKFDHHAVGRFGVDEDV